MPPRRTPIRSGSDATTPVQAAALDPDRGYAGSVPPSPSTHGQPEPIGAGDVQRLFLAHAESIRASITALAGGDAALADDVFQEVFLVIDRRAADFRPGADFAAWARGIARHKLLEARRQRRRGADIDTDAIGLLAVDAQPEDDSQRRRQALRECLGTLSPRARELTELRYRSQLSPQDIAERVGWTVNAVNVALSRVRRHLRACAERRLGPDGR